MTGVGSWWSAIKEALVAVLAAMLWPDTKRNNAQHGPACERAGRSEPAA